jgi:hypothetical protein
MVVRGNSGMRGASMRTAAYQARGGGAPPTLSLFSDLLVF